MFPYVNGKKVNVQFNGDRFFLRGSVEYTNPQLTVEEIQGIIGTKLLEVCGNYFANCGLHSPDGYDISQLCELLKKPSDGYIVAFLLNTDDVEPDRYSINPLKQSIVDSGQSAFPAAYLKTDQLKIDEAYLAKYGGSLISRTEAQLITECLKSTNGSYLDLVDSVKYTQMEQYSKVFGINLSLYALRMPLSTLQAESQEGLVHHIIAESHHDYQAISEAYACMGRSMTKRTTLLTVPHSKKGYGSKRAARGKVHFEGNKLLDVTVKYKTTKLYPNAMDLEDTAVAVAEDSFVVPGEKLAEYDFQETPSSPQFSFTPSSPEDAAVWHAVGSFPLLSFSRRLFISPIACRKET